MSTFEILIDSTGEMHREEREKYGVDYCPMTLCIDDGPEVPASLDYDQGYTSQDYYNAMREGKRIYTAQVRDAIFLEKFTAILERGHDVLYISCSGALSKSIDAGRKVAESLACKYPGRKIVCFDSLISCYGQYDMAVRAAKMRDEGKTVDEAVAWLEANKYRFNQFCTVETLKYLRIAGRVKASAAFFGNLFAVKPIIISDRAGNNNAYMKVKGRKASMLEIVKQAVDAAEDIEHQTVYIGHADAPEDAAFLKEELLKLAKPGEVYVGPLGPIIGSTTGPGTVVLYVFGKEVSI